LETDEVYVGVDRRGAQYVVPVQAKGGKDALSVVQIWQDMQLCKSQYASVVPRPLAAQFMDDADQQVIALFEFETGDDDYDVVITNERQYMLVPQGEISDDELRAYQRRRM
jgi:hypothetical protein